MILQRRAARLTPCDAPCSQLTHFVRNIRIVSNLESCRRRQNQVAKIVHCGLPHDSFEALSLVFQTTAPARLKETEHFRRRRQQKVAKIVQCGDDA